MMIVTNTAIDAELDSSLSYFQLQAGLARPWIILRLTRGPWRGGPSCHIDYQEMRDRLRGLGC